MEHFVSETVGRTFIMRLERGDLLREQIIALAKQEGIKNAVIISGIATFDEVEMQMAITNDYPIGFRGVSLRETIELASLDGAIIDSQPHIHAVVGNGLQTWAGHVLDGCRILYLGEIVIQELLGAELTRKEDANGVAIIYEKD